MSDLYSIWCSMCTFMCCELEKGLTDYNFVGMIVFLADYQTVPVINRSVAKFQISMSHD